MDNIGKIASFGPGSEVRLTRGQFVFITILGIVLVVSGLLLRLSVLQYLQVFVGVCTAFFSSMFIFSLFTATNGMREGSLIDVSSEEIENVLNSPSKLSRLPFVSVIVAAYKEAPVSEQLIASLKALVYPMDKFEVLLVLEERDLETIEAFNVPLPENWQVVIRPHGGVKTKPAAMNYLLKMGYVNQNGLTVVFDAEDKPAPYQMLEAVLGLRKARKMDKDIVCIQARLEFSQNATEGWLQRMLNLDYLQHFGLILPGLSRAGFIAPLGGTSNYIITEVLLSVGGWDERNVTEDLNLAVMLARLGYGTRVLNSVTAEEAVTNITAFIAQRSRWIKGGIQTYFRHMRNPIGLYKDLGGLGFLSFQLVVGAPLVLYLINPLFWGLTFAYALTRSEFIQQLYPPLVFYAAMFSFSAGNFMYVYLLKTASFRTKQFSGVVFAFFAPFYWLLLSLAGYKAFLEFILSGEKAQTWSKTQHKGSK